MLRLGCGNEDGPSGIAGIGQLVGISPSRLARRTEAERCPASSSPMLL